MDESITVNQPHLYSLPFLTHLYREMWPDDVFGSDGMTLSQELDTLRELLMNPLSCKLTV